MRPAWRLATSTLAARPSRTILLVAVVALSCGLIAAVSCAMATAQLAVHSQLESHFGFADIRIDTAGSHATLDDDIVDRLRARSDLQMVVPWKQDAYSVEHFEPVYLPAAPTPAGANGRAADAPQALLDAQPLRFRVRSQVRAFELDLFPELSRQNAFDLIAGRLPQRSDEVLVDTSFLEGLTAGHTAPDAGIAPWTPDRAALARDPALVPPDRASPLDAAEHNAAVGPRLEDTVRLAGVRLRTEAADQAAVAAQPRLPVAVSQAPGLIARAGELATETGIAEAAVRLSEAPGFELLRLARAAATAVDAAGRTALGVGTGLPVRIVGVVASPPLGGRARMIMPLERLDELDRRPAGYSRIDLTVREGLDPEAVAADIRAELNPPPAASEAPETLATPAAPAPDGFVVMTTARITAGIERNLESGRLGLMLVGVLSFMAAVFIIATAMNTALAEQQRALAVVRCVGGTRTQLAQTQLLSGLLIGTAGAALGVPGGVGLAWLLSIIFRHLVPSGFALPIDLTVLAGAGAIASGVAGSAWPAWRASRTSPLRAKHPQSRGVPVRGIFLTAALGLGAVIAEALLVGIPTDGRTIFWAYTTAGLPLMFGGYFLLCVPLLALSALWLGGPVGSLLGLPRRLLTQTVLATPFRYGLTAGAMMSGLGLMVAMWINSAAITRDWIGSIQFPDAFINGTNLRPETIDTLEKLPFVRQTAAISLKTVRPVGFGFGIEGISDYNTTYVGFDVEKFLAMAQLDFPPEIPGNDPAAALAKLSLGPRQRTLPGGTEVRIDGSVLVGREFNTAFGIGPGDIFTCARAQPDGVDVGEEDLLRFEIVGVVVNPGLELVSQFFNVGQDFVQQSLHAIAGPRADLKRIFGEGRIALIQIDLADPGEAGAISDDDAVRAIQAALPEAGILEVGSGRGIKEQIEKLVDSMVLVFAGVSALAMLIAGFAVANLIAASIEARQREFGVLRSIGAGRGLLVRLVLAEAVLIAITAAIVGTAIGIQGAWTGQRLYATLMGLRLTLGPTTLPYADIAVGWLMVAFFTLAAAGPSMLRLNARTPRELLAS